MFCPTKEILIYCHIKEDFHILERLEPVNFWDSAQDQAQYQAQDRAQYQVHCRI